MQSLKDVAQNPAQRQALVDDIHQLIGRRVQAVRGLSGMAIRGGYKVVSKMRGGRMIPSAVNTLLDSFCAALDPFVDDFREAGDASFKRYLKGKESQVSNALLSITDARAEKANPLLQGPYRKLRSFGETQVETAVPEIADIVQRAVS